MKTKIAVMFGGVSAEREVSIITGLQVIEKVNKKLFEVYAIELTRDGLFCYYPGLKKRKDYLRAKRKVVQFGKDKNGSYFGRGGVLASKTYIDAALLAFHGGNGESGQLQGFFETLDIAYTSPGVEASAISMNKALTKEVLESNNLKTIPWTRAFSKDVKNNLPGVIRDVEDKVGLPVIVKPVHLGSSIAINVARTIIELKKFLLEASYIDSEILVEKFITGFKEFNVSVRQVDGKICASEIERPIPKDQILTFADKYKCGGKKIGGMASLSRELPAKISKELTLKIQNSAIKAYSAIRAKGIVRIDFMLKGKILYLIEVNSIPGSMSFYLWEASGISFTDIISQEIKECIKNKDFMNSLRLKYKSGIVEKFVEQEVN